MLDFTFTCTAHGTKDCQRSFCDSEYAYYAGMREGRVEALRGVAIGLAALDENNLGAIDVLDLQRDVIEALAALGEPDAIRMTGGRE